MHRIADLALVLGALTACGSRVRTETLEDRGTACLLADGAVQLDFEHCLSSSCHTLVSATCAGTLAGDTLTVTGQAVIHRQGQICTADCGDVSAICTGDVPAAVEGITVSIGGKTAPLAICDESKRTALDLFRSENR